MKFSIIIPVYNVAPYLRECLDSVVKAAEQVKVRGEGEQWNVEIICVDDGSTDGSGEILDEYASTFQPSNLSTFKVIHQSNGGEGAARNAALRVAKGEWVVFLDSDDVIKEDLLQFVIEQTTLHPHAEMVTYVAECFGEDSLPDWHPRFSDKPRLLSVETELPSELAWYGICCFSVKRECLRGLAFRDFKLGADVVFVLQVLLRVKEIVLTKDVKYGYRLVSTSMSHKVRSPALVTDHIRYMRALFRCCADSRKRLGAGFTTKRVNQLVAVIGSELLSGFNDRTWEGAREEWYSALADLKDYDFLSLPQRFVIRGLLIARCRLAVALLCAVPLRLKRAART